MNDNTIKVSVIIPMFNPVLENLDNMLLSIKKQTFTDTIEIILVNDGSSEKITDGITAVVSKFNSLQIRIIYQSNSGVSVARNQGIEYAAGEYISFIDSDDYIVPYFIEKAYSLAKQYDADVVFGDLRRTDKMDSISVPSGKPEAVLIGESIDHAKLSMLGTQSEQFTYKVSGSPCGSLYKRNLLENIRFDPDIRYFEDQIFNRQILQKAEKIVVSPDVWYFYFTNPGSAMHASRIDPDVQIKINNLLDAAAELNRNEIDRVRVAYKRYLLHMYIAFLSLVYKKTGRNIKETKAIINNLLERQEYVDITKNKLPGMSFKEKMYRGFIKGKIIGPVLLLLRITKKL